MVCKFPSLIFIINALITSKRMLLLFIHPVYFNYEIAIIQLKDPLGHITGFHEELFS